MKFQSEVQKHAHHCSGAHFRASTDKGQSLCHTCAYACASPSAAREPHSSSTQLLSMLSWEERSSSNICALCALPNHCLPHLPPNVGCHSVH
eukprot:2000865-Rhodomonas_salina.1